VCSTQSTTLPCKPRYWRPGTNRPGTEIVGFFFFTSVGPPFSAFGEERTLWFAVAISSGNAEDYPKRCEISDEALNDHFGGDHKDKPDVFRANKTAIEGIARRKYLAVQTEPDGSILIRTMEL
jgi:hypothetical protein